MNTYLLAAGVLLFLVGLAHSVFGELMIFRRLRKNGVVPTEGGKLLGEGHVRILWASWHFQTALGWAMAAMLVCLARQPSQALPSVADIIALSMLAGAALVLAGTKGKHPGWIGLLGVAILVWIGRS
jgi:hypothetical protein